VDLGLARAGDARGLVRDALGLLRMLFTSLYQRGAQNGDAMFVLELALVAVGAFLTFKAYWRPGTLRSSKGIEA
jgi:hypothetical protein